MGLGMVRAAIGSLVEVEAPASPPPPLLRVELGTAERQEPVVLVYDVMHTRAWGEPVDPPEDAPVAGPTT